MLDPYKCIHFDTYIVQIVPLVIIRCNYKVLEDIHILCLYFDIYVRRLL